MRFLKRKPKTLAELWANGATEAQIAKALGTKTYTELVAEGVIHPEAVQQAFLPQGRRIGVKYFRRTASGVELDDWVLYRSWAEYRMEHRSAYYGHPIIERRVIPTGIREPIELIGNLGAGYSDARYRAAKAFLVAKGLAIVPEED